MKLILARPFHFRVQTLEFTKSTYYKVVFRFRTSLKTSRDSCQDGHAIVFGRHGPWFPHKRTKGEGAAKTRAILSRALHKSDRVPQTNSDLSPLPRDRGQGTASRRLCKEQPPVLQGSNENNCFARSLSRQQSRRWKEFLHNAPTFGTRLPSK